MISKIRNFIVGLTVLIFLLATINFVWAVAQPEGPSTLSEFQSTRRTARNPETKEAEAGNITELIIRGETVTQTWHGFVGNVTGTITLDDSSNNTLYNWSLGDPEGEVYATYLHTINWTTGAVKCWNWSLATGSYLQLGELEGWANDGQVPGGTNYTNLSLKSDDVDGVNETFTCTICADGSEPTTQDYNHTSFFVGGQEINGFQNYNITGACPYVKTYNSTAGAAFEEVLLYQDTNSGDGINHDGLIYTALLQSDVNGYNNQSWDFQMIVGENGHNGDVSTTTYYFYVELE